MSRIAMLGGTFDPIHRGHITLGERFAECLELDKLLIIPTGTPPHKRASQTEQDARLEMCRLAVQDRHEMGSGCEFEVCDIEFRREGKSYSYDTVRELHGLYPGCELFLITGADMFVTLEKWYRFDDLKKLVTFCAAQRDDDINNRALYDYAVRLRDMGARCFIEEFPPIAVSSTMVRQAAARGDSLTDMVTPGVEEYIKKHNLYSYDGEESVR